MIIPSDANFTVRLNFEPAGRGVGEEGLYYQLQKENRCVVCGHSDVLRKNVVPREYRKHFPISMKSHTSYDVLILCPPCHQRSNISDLQVRLKLAKMCNAPLVPEESAIKSFEVPELKQLRSAARALLQQRNKIPTARRTELEEILRDFYKLQPTESVDDVLDDAANIETMSENQNYTEHGRLVVTKYSEEFGGILELQKLWREHFLHTMRPKYLPAMWNVNHNAER